jgi:hypothetical protein
MRKHFGVFGVRRIRAGNSNVLGYDSQPLLPDNAIHALKQWQFKPG